MIKVGLTGSIGSGKSMVASVLEHLKVPVYHADLEARKILEKQEVIHQLVEIFGKDILDKAGNIDRAVLAEIVFSTPSDLIHLNEIIHPRVKAGFDAWLSSYSQCSYIVQEAAILFESGFDKYFDKTIVVTAPQEICISRVMLRDGITAEQVAARMKNQWAPSRKIEKADYILENDGTKMLVPQVLFLHQELIRLSNS
jgi:dephospho-CoA kinase